ncbi:MAG: hypothetical protein LRY55_09340 [Leadbetterella sp.]|nr:hypothetical protein [Leadbetterella sp.]
MIIFVSNIPVHILEKPEAVACTQVFDLKNEIVKFDEITGRPLIRNATHRSILDFIEFLQVSSATGPAEVFFEVKDGK